ncbi:hypothetical protein TVAG_226880 [Trichomonas vaginalis G3]|uniref:DUF3447 domain-containing protein n=1 Tax=Trichomonas vaginalis (strain ATCC PRA-98 / G3) TaxID=412133 RepID=A2FCD2_TRIV3|nr:proteasome regulatory particle assembly [Trichomonas vaginalis G3]EAX97444.1 hypothetical protein TVAG_226880 [Trichomonas vaginalis G3]KAI5552002.1 proteasome regulatory particle assembly [Trichomonas vaginalis G3]|eukprot:XP_001310374.1 hypothetical protein [Trichomonas vaginalis G3]
MSDKSVIPIQYDEFMDNFKECIDSFNALYQLKTNNEEEIRSIYKLIKINLLESKIYLPQFIIQSISTISIYNNRYMKAYLQIVKQIFDDYHPECIKEVKPIFNYLFYKEYGIFLEELDQNDFQRYEKNNYTSNIHQENTIYSAIMENNKVSLVSFTEREGFDKYQRLKNELYPDSDSSFSLLEICCYYGSVDCFKFLKSQFKLSITQKCLRFSFLSGNQEIMNKCLKHHKPDNTCMQNAIIKHNIDFVTFLSDEYKININLEYCGMYNNLLAFFVYLDQTRSVDKCFACSTLFNNEKLCTFLISHGANINTKDKNGCTALHFATLYNCTKMLEFLILHGADINAKNESGCTILHFAAELDKKDIAEILISYGADINAKNEHGRTPLHFAAQYNQKEIAEILILHDADISARDKDGRTALSIAYLKKSKEVAQFLNSYTK